MANENRRKLYNAINQAGYDIGDYDEFDKRMNNAADRQKFFQAVNDAGYDIGSQEEFERRISPSKYKLKTGGKYIPVGEREYKDFVSRKSGSQKPSQPSNFQQTIDNALGTVSQARQTVNRIGNKEKQIGLNVPKSDFGRVDIGKNRKVTTKGNRYVTEAGNEYENRAMADVEQYAIEDAKRRELDPIGTELEDAYAERDRIDNLLKSRIEEIKKERYGKGLMSLMLKHAVAASHSGGFLSSASSPFTDYESDREFSSLMAAARKNKELITTLEDQRDKKTNDFWHSLGTEITNGYTFSLGGKAKMDDIASLMDARKHLDTINQKRSRGESLTHDEEVAEAVLKNNEWDRQIQAQYGDDYGAWARAGKMGANSADFMLDFLMMGGAPMNVARGVMNAIVKGGERMIGNAVAKGFGRFMLKSTGATLGSMVAGAQITNTIQLGKTGSDIAQSMIGDVYQDAQGNFVFGHYEEDENGNPRFVKGGNSFLTALADAERAGISENGSEVLGTFLPGAGKVFQDLGLSKIARGITALKGKGWYQNYSKFLQTAGFNGVAGEGLEEYGGMVLDALMGGDEWKKIADPRTHLDIWLGVSTMAGMLNAPNVIGTGYSALQYQRYKKATNLADVEASTVIPSDTWNALRETIDGTDNTGMADVAMDILSNEELTSEGKRAAMDYIDKLQKMRGYSLGSIAAGKPQDDEEEPIEDESRDLDEGYTEGYDTQDPDIMKQFSDEAQSAEEQLPNYGGKFADMVISGDAVQTMDYLMRNRNIFTDEQIEAAADYYQKKAREDGMLDGVMDRVDLEVARADAEVRSKMHRASNQLIIANSGGNEYAITAGEIGTDPESGNVILIGTGGAVVGKNMSTGATEVLNPSNVQLYSVEKVDDLIDYNHTTLREKLMQQADDDITNGSPAQEVFELEDTVTLNDGEGGVIEGEIGMLPNSVDGVYVVYTNDRRALQLTEDDLNRRIVAHNGVKVVRGSASQEQVDNTETAENYAQNAPENIRDDNSEAINENEDSGILDNAGGEAGLNQTGANEPPATALSRIPVRLDENGQPVTNKKGKPILDWHKASLEDASAALIETTGGDMLMARDNAAILARNAEEKLMKLRKRRPKGEDPEELAYSSMQLKREIEEQQAIIKQWKDVATSIQKRMEKETAERRAAEEAAKSEEQRRIEAEEARVLKQQQDEAARKRLEEEIEKDRKRREKPYEPMVKARQEMAGDTDALSILDDTEPRSLEEYVSSSLRPHSILWLDASNSERGLKSELGLNRSDMQRFMHLLGTKESGAKPFDTVVVDIHQTLPEGIKEQFTDADVRNVLLELFRSSENSREMMNLAAENRIEEARQAYRENLRREAEAEMEAWAEAYHLSPEERETFEEYLETPPTYIEEEIINQIILENEQNRTSRSMGQEPEQGRTGTETGGGESQVRGPEVNQQEGEVNHGGAGTAETEVYSGGPSIPDNTLAGGTPEFRAENLIVKAEAWLNTKYGYNFENGGLVNFLIKKKPSSRTKWIRDHFSPRNARDVIHALDELAKTKPSEQLKPTDLRDATRVESPEIGVAEANARARYLLSATEKDAEGNAFYEKDGSIDLWAIPELLAMARRQAAPIRLTDRNLKHIINEHGKEIGNTEKIFEFLDDIFRNAKVLRMARGRAMFVIVENAKTNKAAIIKLMPSESGDYYNVETAGYYRKDKWKNDEEVIADLREPGQSDAASDVSKPQIPDENGREPINAETQASSSESKDTNNSGNLQENLGKTSSEEEISQEEGKVDINPSEAQKEAGNYQKGHIKIDGLDISIENPKGSVRRGTDAEGNEWETTMHNTYGYIRGTEGADKDHIDVFLSDDPTRPDKVFIVQQRKKVNGAWKFDELKVLLGFENASQASNAYLSNYEEGWNGMDALIETDMESFKDWLKNGNQKGTYKEDGAWAKIYPGVSTMVADEGEMPEPEQQEVQVLRGTGNNRLPGVGGELPEVPGGYGATAISQGDPGQNRRERELLQGELQVDGLDNPISEQKDGTLSDVQGQNNVNAAVGRGNGASAEENKIQNPDVPLERGENTGNSGRNQGQLQNDNISGQDNENGRLGEGTQSELQDVKEQTETGLVNGTDNNGTDEHKADGEALSPDSQEKALRDAVVDHLRSIGVEVSTDWKEGQRILDEYNGNGQVKKMGTSTRKRQNDILESLKDRSLSEQQKQVADAFSGVSDRIILSVKSKDGKSRNIMFRQGNENRAGVKHSVFRHYNTESNGYTADEVTMIPEIIANGNRKQDQGNRVSYKYEKDGITYTVTTEAKGKNELFTNFYTNKKPSVAEQGTSNTDNRHVQPQQTDSGAKVQQNPETAKDSDRKFFKTPDGHAYGYTYQGKIYIDPRIATSETPVHEYGHLWCEMKRQTAPEEWEQMKQVMLNDEVVQPIIERVRRDYPELAREGKEDDFIEEVITQFSGKRGAERLREIADEVAAERGGIFGKAEAVTAMQRLKNILNSFWESVARMMGWKYRNASQIADRIMADMLNGVDPRGRMNEASGQMRSQQEIERTLMGVHNISEDKLKKVLKQGGLANPSLAVIDTMNHMHTDYGEISLIPRSSMIDARTGRNAGTWTADAWTPTYPQVTKRMSGTVPAVCEEECQDGHAAHRPV